MKGISSFKRTVICICALFLATPLAAQESSKAKDKDKDKADDKAIEEVVVTATYRKTNLMDTPMGIGAVTDELIKELGAQDMGEIFRMVSGLNMGGEGAGQRRYTIRGVTSQQSNSVRDTSGATVAVYLDGSSMTSALGPARQITGNLFDIERVEVLKGPQGTLFGEGAQGGAIRYIYKSPDPTQIDAAVSFGTSTMKQSEDRSFNVNGMVNVPLIADRLAARVSLFQSTRAGWIDRQSGCVEVLFAVPKCSSVIEDVNAWDTEGGRAALQYKADRWSIEGAYYWVSQKGDGTQYTPLDAPYVSNVRPFEGVPGDGWDDYEVARVTGEVDLGFATLTSITTDTSRDTFTFRELFDPLVRIIDNGGANTANNTGRCGLVVGAANCPMPADGANMSDYGWDGWTETSRFTTEMRLVSNGDSRFRWTAGLYYKDSSDWSWSGVLYKMAPGREVYAPIYFFDSPETSHETESSETAVFGEFSYHITDTLELTAGGRFSKLEQNFLIGVKGARIANESADKGAWTPPPSFATYVSYVPQVLGTTSDSEFSPKLVLTWRPDNQDLMAYASYSTGFRPGSANRGVLLTARNLRRDADAAETTGSDPQLVLDNRARADELVKHVFFGPDKVTNYELGVKASLFNGRAKVQSSIYRLDWQDVIQRAERQIPGQQPITFNANEGAAEINGIDLDITARLMENLRVTLAAAYIDTELTEAAQNQGKELIFTSPLSYTLSLDYDLPIDPNLMATFHVDHSRYDEQWYNAANNIELPKYNITNARITLRNPNGSWRVVLWAKNLTDEIIVRDRYSDLTSDPNPWFGLGTYQYLEPPRSVGLDFSWALD